MASLWGLTFNPTDFVKKKISLTFSACVPPLKYSTFWLHIPPLWCLETLLETIIWKSFVYCHDLLILLSDLKWDVLKEVVIFRNIKLSAKSGECVGCSNCDICYWLKVSYQKVLHRKAYCCHDAKFTCLTKDWAWLKKNMFP
jgi:hypothetical protein